MIYNREIDPFTCESNAYQRLKSKGLCEQGVIPDFYGVIENINPKEAEWEPHLEKFTDEELPLNAVLMEYIPNMHQIDLSTYSEERLEKLHAILKEIHAAGVLHDDLYPRNMMVQVDTGRVLWIDFDRAQTFVEGAITKMQQEWIDFEKALMEEFVKFLVIPFFERDNTGWTNIFIETGLSRRKDRSYLGWFLLIGFFSMRLSCLNIWKIDIRWIILEL